MVGSGGSSMEEEWLRQIWWCWLSCGETVAVRMEDGSENERRGLSV